MEDGILRSTTSFYKMRPTYFHASRIELKTGTEVNARIAHNN